MVLSNKKLKQKLRSLLAESISATESSKSHKYSSSSSSGVDLSQQVESIRELLGSKSRKPDLPKRPRRKKKPSLSQDPNAGEDNEETKKADEEEVAKEEEKKRNKKLKRKRKREGEVDNVPVEKKEKKLNKKRKREGEVDNVPVQKKEKKKKKKKPKKKKKKDEEKVKAEKEEGHDDDKGVEESIKIDESEIKKVYVGGVPYYSTEDDIRSFFEGCGTITEVDCMRFPETGKFRGIAILTFKTEAAAKRALALDGADMGGFFLKIQHYKANRMQKSDFAPEIVEGYNRTYVGNLSWDITEDDLKKFFSDCKISTIRFGMDKETGDFKGYAHVDFADSVSLAIALKLDQKLACGRPVRIRCAVPRKGVETTNASKKSDGNIIEDDQNTVASKKKRRTCYECGIPGHLSSACPQKKRAVEADGSDVKTHQEATNAGKKSDGNIIEDAQNTVTSKKRRTCYECGIPGHLSSACPQKKTAVEADGYNVESLQEVIDASSKDDGDITEDGQNTVTSKKRRTCYECGVPGHLSSACPQKKKKKAVEAEGSGIKSHQETVKGSSKPDGNEVDDGQTTRTSKKKRRTCYECGTPGHLSSDCPQKKTSLTNGSDVSR